MSESSMESIMDALDDKGMQAFISELHIASDRHEAELMKEKDRGDQLLVAEALWLLARAATDYYYKKVGV